MFKKMVLVILLVGVSLSSDGQVDDSTARDCTQFFIGENDSPLLTREEMIQLKEQALYQSIDSYHSCVEKKQLVEKQSVTTKAENVAASDASARPSSAKLSAGATPPPIVKPEAKLAGEAVPAVKHEGAKRKVGAALMVKPREEISPPGDNDGEYCKIMYDVYQNETDSEKKRKLLEEYDDYGCG